MDPESELHSKIAHVYEGFDLITNSTRRAADYVMFSPRAESSQAGLGIMGVARSIIRWVVPLAEEVSADLAGNLDIDQKHIEAIDLEIRRRIDQLKSVHEAGSLQEKGAAGQQ